MSVAFSPQILQGTFRVEPILAVTHTTTYHHRFIRSKGEILCERFFYLELSSQVQHNTKENFIGRFPVEAFTRTTIQFGSEGGKITVIKGFKIN